MVKTFDNINELSKYAARAFVRNAKQSIRERGRFLASISGGSTPVPLYRLLGGEYRERVPWVHVHFFWCDERCVPVDNAGNNYGQTQKALFDKIDIPTKNIHRVRSDLEPAQAAIDYAHTLNQFSEPPLTWPRFDLVFLGMGEDGHTASLFPGSPVEVDSPTLAVNVQYQGSPANRVTLTQNVINSSRNVFFLVAGNTKAAMLLNVLKGEHRPTEVPAQRIAPQEGSLIWLIDKEAGSLL